MRRTNITLSLFLVFTIAALVALVQAQTRLIAASGEPLPIAQGNAPGPTQTATASLTPGFTPTASETDIIVYVGSTATPITPTDPGIDTIFATNTPTRTPTPISVGNFVWDDIDQDGRQDAGEPGLAGVQVQLWNSTKTALLDSDVTDSSGLYTVIAPTPGNYRVRAILPMINDEFSPKNMASGSDLLDSDVNVSGSNFGFTDIYAFSSNLISITSIDIGIIKFRTPTPTRTPTPVNFGNFVWDDIDGDGRQDAGEPGLAGVTVQLWNDVLNDLIDTTTTNANGNYTLQSEGPGNFRVRVILPTANDVFSPIDQADGDDLLDSDIRNTTPNVGFTNIIVIASNVISITSIDAGIIKFRTPTPTRTPTPINVGNFVWNDLDFDGIQDAGEPGIAGVTVQIWSADKLTMYDEAVTNSTGNYTVVAPLPGNYRIRVLKLSTADDFSAKNAFGSSTQTDSNINPSGADAGYSDVFNIASNVISNTTFDAGIRLAIPITIGNRVWWDADGDGIQDSREPNLAGRYVRLRVDAFIDFTVSTAYTDANGQYTVTAPEAGPNYYLCVTTHLTNEVITLMDVGTASTDSDINPSGSRRGCTDNFTINANTVNTDAGLSNPDVSLILDLTLEGRGSPPSALWSMPHQLSIRASDESTVVNVTRTTNTSGRLVYATLADGNYEVWVKGEQSLAVRVNVEVDSGNNLFELGLLRTGDANDDNVVNITDFSILAASFGQALGGASYDERADFNGNNTVDIADFSLLAANFGQAGEPQP